MKIWNYVFIMTMIVVVLAFSGLSTGLDGILNLVGFKATLGPDGGATGSTSTFWDFIFASGGLLVGVGAGVVIAGLFTRAKPENYIILPIIFGPLGLFIDTFVKLINTAKGTGELWVFGIISILLVPLMAGYTFALVEFFRGTD